MRRVEAACGNGTVEAGEECDDGNSENVDDMQQRFVKSPAAAMASLEPI